MLVLAVLGLAASSLASRLPAAPVMPKLHLAYLVEEAEYGSPDGAVAEDGVRSRERRQTSQTFERLVVEPTSVQEAEQTTDLSSATAPEAAVEGGRTSSFAAALAKVLAAAGNPGSTPVVPGTSYSGRRRRQAEAALAGSDNQYGLLEPRVEVVKIKSHGNYGKVVQEAAGAGAGPGGEPLAQRTHTATERRKRSDNFIPFSVYEDRRSKTLKVEENDFHALPRLLQQQAVAGQATVQLTAAL